MAGPGGRTKNPLAKTLRDEAHNFDFFQAVRLLFRMQPDRATLGGAERPENEVARFHSRLTLQFPASAVHEIHHQGNNGHPPDMTVAFMGLTGTQGVLPLFYTEWMLLRESHKDSAMAAFFDLFNHRWISLFYKAWEKHRLPIAFERVALGHKTPGRLNEYVFDLVGLGTPGLRKRLRVSDSTLVYYAGLIAQRARSAPALRGLLRDYFGVPLEVHQFIGVWYELADQDRCYLHPPGISNQLGVGAVLGDAVWDPQSKFEVSVGPLTYPQYKSFLPDGTAAGELTDLVRIFAGTTAAFDIRLILQGEEVPAARVGADRASPRLGWDLWLGEGGLSGDADDAVFAGAA